MGNSMDAKDISDCLAQVGLLEATEPQIRAASRGADLTFGKMVHGDHAHLSRPRSGNSESAWKTKVCTDCFQAKCKTKAWSL